MNSFTSKVTGWLAILTGMMGILSIVTLSLFFVGLFQNLHSLSFMGGLNDRINILAGFLSALLASALHPAFQRWAPRLSLVLLIDAWIGASAITYGSWLIITGRADVELSSYYYLFGNGLIGIWLYMLNRFAGPPAVWPRNLTRLGLIAGALMMIGLLNFYGILLGWDGNDFSFLLLGTGISYLGIGILYPIWCLWLGRWILSRQDHGTLAMQE